MAAPNYHLEHSQTGSGENLRLGIPGKYYAAKKVTAGTTFEFTGSNYGYGAVVIGNAANTATTKIHTISISLIHITLLIYNIIIPHPISSHTHHFWIL